MTHHIREYGASDLPALCEIYRSGIRRFGLQYYSDEQIEAWASFADDAVGFRHWLEEATTLIACDAQQLPIGFASLQADGRIAALFVAPEAMRRGVGSALLEALLTLARARRHAVVATEASEFSKPLFEKFGFVVSAIEHTKVRGVAFSRYRMTLRLT